MQEKRQTNEARSEAMRERLLVAARECFADQGFTAASTPQIVKAADVTRGALYHHFKDKTDLFRAVVIAESAAVAAEIRAGAATGADSFAGGAAAYFDAMASPGRARILLQDGPAALGPQTMAEIDAEIGGATLIEAIKLAQPDLQDSVVARLAELLSAAFDRAALSIANGADRDDWIAAVALLGQGALGKR